LERVARDRVAVAHDARQPGAGGDVGRERVHLLLVDELEAVLEHAEEAVRVRERSRVVGSHAAGPFELGQSVERRGRSEVRVAASVHELQELHGELDVAYATATALDLAVPQALAREGVLGPRLHGPYWS